MPESARLPAMFKCYVCGATAAREEFVSEDGVPNLRHQLRPQLQISGFGRRKPDIDEHVAAVAGNLQSPGHGCFVRLASVVITARDYEERSTHASPSTSTK